MWKRAFLGLCLLLGCGALATPATAGMVTGADFGASTHAVSGAVLGDEPGQRPGIPPAGDADLFAAAQVVGEDELGRQRGGFVFDGLNINLGAQIQTFVNGELALLTTVTWTDSVVKNTQVVSGAMVPASAAQLHDGLLQAGNISINVGDSAVYLANDGQTALIHRTDAGIQNILINTASNTDIHTQVNATIDVSGYSGFQASMQSGSLASSLGMAVDAATVGVVTH